jgi:DNA-binding transcriptional LysR family regulator
MMDVDLERLQRRVRLRDLETLSAVVQAGGMRKAAHALNLSQPAVSRAIRELEDALGVKLLQRTRRGVEATEFGDALVRRSTAVFDELRGALRELSHLADPSTAEVRLGCMETVHAGLLPACIEHVTREHPRMRFVLETGNASDLLDHFLRQRLVDFVVARPFAATLPPDMQGEPLFADQLQVVISRRHPLARRRGRLRLRDLVDEHWILSHNEVMDLSPVACAFRSEGHAMPARIITSASLNTRLVLLGSGRFVSVLPHSLLRFGKLASDLRILPVPLPLWDVPTMIVTMRSRTLVPAAELVLNTLRNLSEPFRHAQGRARP